MYQNVKITEPRTPNQFKAYYALRWLILRKPWNQPPGSEKDEFEKGAVHLMATLGNTLVGCGRGHLVSPGKAQIRWMAVNEDYQRSGIGTEILKELEKRLIKKGVSEIILKAREKAVNLYQNQGYEIFDEGEVMFGEIMHYWMRKIY